MDTYRVFNDYLEIDVTLFWHENTDNLEKYDAIILPGGFSYGDRLRAGIIASLNNSKRFLLKANLSLVFVMDFKYWWNPVYFLEHY